MTTKPKAYKFRVGGRALAALRAAAGQPDGSAAGNRDESGYDDGFGNRVFPTAAAASAEGQLGESRAAQRPRTEEERAGGNKVAADGPAPDSAEAEAIRAEGLTGRQLRMARRVAQKHGIEVASDYQAVQELRQRGIDPFKHANMLELVVEADEAEAEEQAQPPSTRPRWLPTVPAARPSEDDRRAREIVRVQREIARRRKRRFALMLTRLAAFVFLPTFLAGYYFYVLATPMYATKSEFVIQQAAPQGAGGISSLFSGTAMATAQDSMTVQSYLQSREAMLRLEGELGFKAYFAAPGIDPLQRLEADATNEAAYKVYSRNVKISYDPTEGIVKMEVIAPDPGMSAAMSRALISYAEEQVDHLTQRLREDQMAGARQVYEEAEQNVLAAQQRVIELQERRGIISADAEVTLLMSQISGFETELQRERLSLQQYMENPTPNEARVSVAENNIARLERLIAELRAQMTESNAGADSLARITGELLIAEGDLATRQMLLAQALQQMETARIEANRQVRYLSTGVSPVAPDQATYPRAFENTLVSFLIFAGIYLMISITAAILREQVSA